MINTLILKDYFQRHKWVVPIASMYVLIWIWMDEMGVEKMPYGHALYMNFLWAFFFYNKGRAEVKTLAMLPESPRRLGNTLFLIAVMVMPLIDLAGLVVDSLYTRLFTGSWPFPLIHLPLVFVAGIAWGGALLWLFLADSAAMAKKGKDASENTFFRPINITLPLWLYPLWEDKPIILPMGLGLTLIALGLVLSLQAWRKMPCLYGPPSVQFVKGKPRHSKRKAIKPFSPSLGSFLFGNMLSVVIAAVVFWQIRQRNLKIENADQLFTAMYAIHLFWVPMFSIGIVWPWTSAIRALRALPLPSWKIVLIYVRILSAMIVGLLIWMGIAAIVFQDFLAMKYLLLYALLIFFSGILICCLQLRAQWAGMLAGIIAGITSSDFFLRANLLTSNPLTSANLLLIMTALSCYWLYRLIAFNSQVYRNSQSLMRLQ